jgi:hypothetical protein
MKQNSVLQSGPLTYLFASGNRDFAISPHLFLFEHLYQTGGEVALLFAYPIRCKTGRSGRMMYMQATPAI